MTARKFLALPLAFAGGVILASFAACTGTNDSHCSVKGGDVYCQEKTGQAEGAVFCTNNCGGDYDFDGCLVATEAPADDCWLCEGEGSDNCGSIGDGDSDSTDADTTADTETADATETMDTTTAETGPECTMSGDCSMVGEPLCDGDACVGCGDAVAASCAADYPETPVCDAGSGACVECTVGDVSACPAEEPACEGGVCVPCDEHEQCPDSACNMATGACMPTDRVWWVDQSVGASGDGSEASPKKTIGEVLDLIGDGEEGTIYLATPGVHNEPVTIDGGRIVALIGEQRQVKSNAASTVSVSQAATLFLWGIGVIEGDVGIMCSTCNMWIDQGQISENNNGEVQVLGGDVHIRNSFIGHAGLVNVAALTVSSGTVEILYSTLAGGGFNSPAIGCINGTGVVVRNSLVVALQPGEEVACPGVMIADSATEVDLPGNTSLGNMPDTSWFTDYVTGKFHLTPAAPAAISAAAIWQTGDPSTDIEGDARPTIDGTADYAGADVLN